MCGIFFYVQKDKITGKRKIVIENAFKTIKHRGPDASKVRYYNSDTMMGFHRLAIVDESNNGMQPFESESSGNSQVRRYAIIANGEIYNYRDLIQRYNLPVRSDSDCEVILHLFQHIIEWNGSTNQKVQPELHHIKELCEALDGEFAFIIYDTMCGDVFFGVDELRVRPLFMGMNDDKSTFILASEQKAITGFDESYHVSIVPPGSVGVYKDCKLTQEVYFKIPDIRDTRRELDYHHVLRELLETSVRKKLNPEREFCFLLSGGLDSSLICGIAAKQLKPMRIRTFTVGFDKNASDVIAARKVAKHINSIHREFIFTYAQGEAALRDVIRFNESWDQTTTRASVPMFLAIRAIKDLHPEMAVIYSGEMSDELFMGYMEWKQCKDPEESRKHVIKRLMEISQFDGLRADRMVSSQGCELRLPFFDSDILLFVLMNDPKWFMPCFNNGIEKHMLRRAFDGINILPHDILWRTKHAFSDATSIVGTSSWKEYLKTRANEEITDSRFDERRALYPYCTPQTKEDMWYREIFDEYGYDATCIPSKWLPNWSNADITDASATALSVFTESTIPH